MAIGRVPDPLPRGRGNGAAIERRRLLRIRVDNFSLLPVVTF